MKPCLLCRSQIADDAIVCRYCRNPQDPRATAGGDTDKAAARVVGLIDFLVKFFGIPIAIIATLALAYGIKELADVRKATAEVDVAKKDVTSTLKLVKEAADAMGTMLTGSISLEVEAVLDLYGLDSESKDLTIRIERLESHLATLDSFYKGKQEGSEPNVSLARGLVAYKRGKYKDVITIFGDPPAPDGLWQRHILAAAYARIDRVANKNKILSHREAMVRFARNRSTLQLRAEQNLAVAHGIAGDLDKAIEVIEGLLKTYDHQAIPRANLAGFLAKRNKPGDRERAYEELKTAIEKYKLCISFETMEKDEELRHLITDFRYTERIRHMIRTRGPC